MKQDKLMLQKAIEDEIYEKLGKKIVSMFEWAYWAQQQKKQPSSQELGKVGSQ